MSDTLQQVYYDRLDELSRPETWQPFHVRFVSTLDAVGDDAVRRWKESDEGKAWRQQTVAEYFAKLEPGDNGLYHAFCKAWAEADPTCAVGTRERIGIAAVLDLFKRRMQDEGWLTPEEADQANAAVIAEYFTSLPPGDEGLLYAFDIAWYAQKVGHDRTRAGIAAVLDLYKRRMRDDGWLTPEEADQANTAVIAEYFAKLPPGDEGLVRAFCSAFGIDGYVSIGRERRLLYANGIAAVLDLQRRRDEEAGWLSPGKAGTLYADAEGRSSRTP